MELEAEVGGRRLRVSVSGRNGHYTVSVDGRELEVDASGERDHFLSLLADAVSCEPGLARVGEGRYRVSLDGRDHAVAFRDALPEGAAAARGAAVTPGRVTAPMPGKILEVLVELNQAVEAGQGLLVMEAMKMENELRAPRAGTVRELGVREGEAVETGALLALLE